MGWREVLFKRIGDQITEQYGNDPNKWRETINVLLKCRADRVQGFNGLDLRADLYSGKKKCPLKNCEKRGVKVPSYDESVVGYVSVTNFPEKCLTCGMSPDIDDFERM